MSQEAEQIGDLIYMPNPDYPYQINTEHPPHFWMTEQTGKLAPVVEAYLNGEKLTPEDFDLIQQYLRQYLERVVMAGEANRRKLVSRVDKLRSTRDIERFADELSEFGVEPF